MDSPNEGRRCGGREAGREGERHRGREDDTLDEGEDELKLCCVVCFASNNWSKDEIKRQFVIFFMKYMYFCQIFNADII